MGYDPRTQHPYVDMVVYHMAYLYADLTLYTQHIQAICGSSGSRLSRWLLTSIENIFGDMNTCICDVYIRIIIVHMDYLIPVDREPILSYSNSRDLELIFDAMCTNMKIFLCYSHLMNAIFNSHSVNVFHQKRFVSMLIHSDISEIFMMRN